jgi:4-hydroxybenzoate polyprenyltransferase
VIAEVLMPIYLGLAFSFGIPMAFAAVQGRVPPEAWLMFTDGQK